MSLWRVFHTTMVSRLEDSRRFNGLLVRTMRGTVSTHDSQGKRRSGTWNLGHVFSSGQSDSRSDWRSIQVRALAGTRPCHHDRGRSTMEWIGAFHDRTNWCCLIRCHPTQLRRCSEREVSIASLKGLVQVSKLTSVTELTNALSPGKYEDMSTSLPTRDDLRFGEVDSEALPVDQAAMAPSSVLLFPSGTVVAPSQNTPTSLSSIPNPVSAFLHLLVVSLMCKLMNLL